MTSTTEPTTVGTLPSPEPPKKGPDSAAPPPVTTSAPSSTTPPCGHACFDGCFAGLGRIPGGMDFAQCVRTDDECNVELRAVPQSYVMAMGPSPMPPRLKFVCRSSTFTLSDGRTLGFAVITARNKCGKITSHTGTRFNQMLGLGTYERTDTYYVTRPLIVVHGMPGGRLCVKQPALTTMCLESGMFDCLIGIDRPGYGLSTPNARSSPSSFANDVHELMEILFPSAAQKCGVFGFDAGAPYVAGIVNNPYFSKHLRGAVVVGGLGQMKKQGTVHRNYDSIRLGTHRLAPFVKQPACVMHMHHWLYVTVVSRGKSVAGMPVLCERIAAANKGQSNEVIDGLIRENIAKAYPHHPAKELAYLAEHGGANMISLSVEELACFKYYGSAGLDTDVKVIAEDWDVNWNELRKHKWGIAHGRADNVVPYLHGQWWEEQLPRAETIFLEGHGHMSLLGCKELFLVFRKVYGDEGVTAGCSIA